MPEPLGAGNVDQGQDCHKAGRRVVADGLRTATLSDVTHTAGEEDHWGSQEAAYEDREVSLHHLACADQGVQSRSLAKDDGQGGSRLDLVTAEAGTHHMPRMVADAALGSRSVGDGMLAETRD